MGRDIARDDAAVSPAIGVTIVVAVAVVLASTAAVSVVALGDGADDATPTANFTYEYSQVGNGNLTMAYESGDRLDAGRIEVRADVPFRPAPGNGTGSLSGQAVESYALDSDAGGGDWLSNPVEEGASFTVVGDGSTLANGTIRIVWVEPSSDQPTVLGEWRGPDA